jgi:hypothetical protein
MSFLIWREAGPATGHRRSSQRAAVWRDPIEADLAPTAAAAGLLDVAHLLSFGTPGLQSKAGDRSRPLLQAGLQVNLR